MSKYDYTRGKFITIATTQDIMLFNTKSLNILLNSDCNGVVILPLTDEDDHFSIKDKNDDYALDWIDSMMGDLVDENFNIKVWIGMPRIDSNTVPNIVSGTGSGSTYKRFQKYVDYFMSKKYKNNVYGFLYNQEAIYNEITLNNPMANKEAKLMNDIAYYIRNTYQRDMIWIPYYGTGKNDNEANENAEKVAIIANKTTSFDCVFIQAMHIGDRYDLSDTVKNFLPIVKSAKDKDSLLYKRDSKNTFIDANNKIGNCNIGVEYEYSYYDELNNFSQYVRYYKDLSCPKLFYWQGIIKEKGESNSDVREKISNLVDVINDLY